MHLTDEMKTLANLGTFVLCLSILSFSGQTQALTCVECTDIDFDIPLVGAVLSGVLDAIPGIHSKTCRSATLTSNIKKTVCPANPNGIRGEVYKCGSTSGKLTVTVGLWFTGWSASGKFVDRRCVLEKRTSRDRCHKERDVSELIGGLSKVVAAFSNIGSVSYEGTHCVESNIPRSASRPRSSASRPRSSAYRPRSSASRPTSSAFKLIGTFSFLLQLIFYMK